MSDRREWQRALLDDLSAGLRVEEGVKALVLTGSLADDAVEIDEWSDVDLTAIVADDALLALFSNVCWLERHGNVIGLERHEKPNGGTLRVCFAPMRRVDITLVRESVLVNRNAYDDAPPGKTYAVLWSKIPQIEQSLSGLLPHPTLNPVPAQDIATIIEGFCFEASVAIAKTMRNDLLVALHLALDLARDCLLLQMLRRDRDTGTNVHRIGGPGNDVAARLCRGSDGPAPMSILDLVERSAFVLDELASDLLPSYVPRAELLLPGLRQAQAACGAEVCHNGKGRPQGF